MKFRNSLNIYDTFVKFYTYIENNIEDKIGRQMWTLFFLNFFSVNDLKEKKSYAWHYKLIYLHCNRLF